MSIIALTTIFLQKDYGPKESIVIDDVLRKYSDKVNDSRKGRYWEVVKNNRLYYVDVRTTESKIFDCEEELSKLSLLPEDIPEVIFITSSLGKEQDFVFCNAISNEIAKKLEGITNGTKYSS